jgi:hypothetical protein
MPVLSGTLHIIFNIKISPIQSQIILSRISKFISVFGFPAAASLCEWGYNVKSKESMATKMLSECLTSMYVVSVVNYPCKCCPNSHSILQRCHDTKICKSLQIRPSTGTMYERHARSVLHRTCTQKSYLISFFALKTSICP